MEDEEGYTTLNLQPKKGGSAGLPPARNQGSRQCPRWLLVVLGAGNIILLVAVLSLGVCVSQLVSKGQTPAAPGSDGDGNGDISTANCSTCLERFRSKLTQRLCPPTRPSPAGGSRCKLCPMDWRLREDKCYWVSSDSKMWSESRSDCSERGSRLLVIRDRAELKFLQDLTHGANEFWVGLSVPSAEKGWAWLDGSQLDWTLIQGLGHAKGGSCGAVNKEEIHSDSCSSALPWICQRDAVLI